MKEYLLFSKRKALAECYEKRRDENHRMANCPVNVITFLYGNDLLNVENVKAFLEKGGEQK